VAKYRFSAHKVPQPTRAGLFSYQYKLNNFYGLHQCLPTLHTIDDCAAFCFMSFG